MVVERLFWEMRKRNIIGILVLFAIIALWIVIGLHKTLVVTPYVIEIPDLPEELQGFKIVQISDLHYQNFGENNEELVELIKGENPDVIVITGDTIDGTKECFEPIEGLLSGISNLCPIYAVGGNHELDSEYYYGRLLELYEKYGVEELRDQSVRYTKNGASLFFYGIPYGMGLENMKMAEEADVSVLLAHDPQVADYVTEYGYDVMFSGHIHGGIVRIPFVGGLLGTNREFFPKYDGGIYHLGDMTMVDSKGLGEVAHIPRFYNNPEIVSVTLSGKL